MCSSGFDVLSTLTNRVTFKGDDTITHVRPIAQGRPEADGCSEDDSIGRVLQESGTMSGHDSYHAPMALSLRHGKASHIRLHLRGDIPIQWKDRANDFSLGKTGPFRSVLLSTAAQVRISVGLGCSRIPGPAFHNTSATKARRYHHAVSLGQEASRVKQGPPSPQTRSILPKVPGVTTELIASRIRDGDRAIFMGTYTKKFGKGTWTV